MKKRAPRTPQGYDGTKVTSRKLSDLLSNVLSHIHGIYEERPDMILAAWPLVIGPQLAPMTQAISFSEGVLQINVTNATLYSVLSQQNKSNLIKSLREKFPKIAIRDIMFRRG